VWNLLAALQPGNRTRADRTHSSSDASNESVELRGMVSLAQGTGNRGDGGRRDGADAGLVLVAMVWQQPHIVPCGLSTWVRDTVGWNRRRLRMAFRLGYRRCGRQPRVFDCSETSSGRSGKLSLAMPGFRVRILSGCSGLEGVGLVLAFLSFYLWWYRDQLRMPRALVLLPIGVVAAWTLNVVRIMVLMLIGVHYRRLAQGGFHSGAGWILFNALSFGIVAASWQFESLGKEESRPASQRIEAAFLPGAASRDRRHRHDHAYAHDGFDFLYPLRVIAALMALVYFRERLATIDWWPSPSQSTVAIGIGFLVFAIWIAFARGGDAGSPAFVGGLRQLPPSQSIFWMTFRVAGALVTVPIAEELAFRGYLIRKFISSDFETSCRCGTSPGSRSSRRRFFWSAPSSMDRRHDCRSALRVCDVSSWIARRRGLFACDGKRAARRIRPGHPSAGRYGSDCAIGFRQNLPLPILFLSSRRLPRQTRSRSADRCFHTPLRKSCASRCRRWSYSN